MIELPFPPALLSGHNTGHYRTKAPIIKKHREWAKSAALAAGMAPLTLRGDIRIIITFYPPDRRGDRVNFPNRMKPYIDGIADAMKVNDVRFLPSYHFAEPTRPGKVTICLA